MDKVRNPKTHRPITIGTQTYKNLLKEGYMYDETTNTLVLSSDNKVHTAPVKQIIIPPSKQIKHQFTPIETSDTNIKILIPDVTINKVIHISDIHIPINLHKRHHEYKQVFDKLYKYIDSNIDKSTSVIVITGDLLHSNVKIEGDTMQMARDFLDKLSKLTHTIVVIGNNDFTNNKDSVDTLSVVADRLPIHILKHTGIYQTGNMLFVFNSLFDNKFIKHSDIPTTNMPIYALFHGTVIGSTTDSGLILKESITRRYPTVDDFDGYNAVLLGHIHKQQFLKPNIAYVGSLIQQNFGEKIQGHGLLLWDTKTHLAESIDIVNDYVHLNISIVDGKITSDTLLEQYSNSKLYIKSNCINTTSEQINSIHKQLTEKYTVERFVSIPNKSIEQQQHNTFLTLDEDITLIKQYAKPDLIEQVIALHKKYYTEHQAITGYWYPTLMTWKNIGIYGNDHQNVINFNNGIINICSNNMTGKSTIVNILLFALFHKTSTHLKAATDILNKYASKGCIELDFIHNGNHYKIQKNLKRMLRTARNSESEIYETNFFRIDETGCANLTASSQSTTLSTIRQYVGSLESFLDGNLISTRADINSILSKTPSELLKHFHRICNTDHYENYVKQCSLDAKTINAQLIKLKNNNSYITTHLQSTSVTETLAATYETLQTYQNQHTTLTERRDLIRDNLAIIKKPIKLPTLSITDIDQNINTYTAQLKLFANNIIETAATTYNIENDISNYKNNLHDGLPSIEDVDNDIIAIELEMQDKPLSNTYELHKQQGVVETEITSLETKISELTNISNTSTDQNLPLDFNIEDAYTKLTETKSKIDHTPHTAITELEILLKHKKLELSQFTLPCLPCSDTTEHELKQLLPVPLKLHQPDDLATQIIDLQIKHKDLANNNTVLQRNTWYKSYITDNTLTNIPLKTFIKYYDDSDRIEFNYIESQLQKLINIQKHNQHVDSIRTQNTQIQNHNENIMKHINWLKKQELIDSIDKLDKSIHYQKQQENMENSNKLKQLQEDCNHYTELINIYNRLQYQTQLTALNSELTNKQHLLTTIKEHIIVWSQYLKLAEELDDLRLNKDQIDENTRILKNIQDLELVQEYMSIASTISELTQQKQTLQDSDTYIELQRQLTEIDDKLKNINNEIDTCNQNITQHTHTLQSMKELEDNNVTLSCLELQINIYEEYKKLFDRKSIPATILKSKLQQFVDQTNRIFSTCTKYKLQHTFTDKDKLIFTIIDCTTNVSLEPHRISGYETIALQIALNKATIDVTTAHKTSLFIIDESLDCIDQERFNNVIDMVCNIIKQHFTVTLIISHRDIPTDIIDQNIHITHSDNCSYIE
jgi:DNA repair exonuclease SbcCD ATPase subunit